MRRARTPRLELQHEQPIGSRAHQTINRAAHGDAGDAHRERNLVQPLARGVQRADVVLPGDGAIGLAGCGRQLERRTRHGARHFVRPKHAECRIRVDLRARIEAISLQEAMNDETQKPARIIGRGRLVEGLRPLFCQCRHGACRRRCLERREIARRSFTLWFACITHTERVFDAG